MKIGIIGTGKRFESIYSDILSKMNAEMFLWNRTKEKIKKYIQKDNNRYFEVSRIDEFNSLDLDLCLCFIPSNICYDIIDKLKLKCNILIETPVEDERWVQKKNIGVLEQWPSMPIELFKEKLYSENLLNRPYWVVNDGRTFDYHAIAQLRSYCLNPTPANIFGLIQNIKQDGFIDKYGKLNKTPDEWTHGIVNFSNGCVLNYSFAYNCKNTNLKTLQLLKSYSSNGSIVSGRSLIMDNDYEMLEIRYLNQKNEVIIEKPERISENNVTKKILLKNKNFFWENDFFELGFNDHQTSIAYVIKNALKNKIYTASDAYMNSLIMFLMKKSAFSNKNFVLG